MCERERDKKLRGPEIRNFRLQSTMSDQGPNRVVELSPEEMDDIYATILDLVEQAGKKIRQCLRESKTVQEKLSRTDLVTQTDKDVEELLIRGILYVGNC